MRRDCVELALHRSEPVLVSIKDSEPCNLSVLADEATFHCVLSAYEELAL